MLHIGDAHKYPPSLKFHCDPTIPLPVPLVLRLQAGERHRYGGDHGNEYASYYVSQAIAKKVAIFLVISVAHVADQYLVDSTDVLRSMTTLFYLSNEGISIFENIGKIGIPLPGKLNNLLSRFEDIKNQMK